MPSNPYPNMAFILVYNDQLTNLVPLQSFCSNRADKAAYRLLDILTYLDTHTFFLSRTRGNFAAKK